MSAFLLPSKLEKYKKVAIGLSGGPDSMALTHMLCDLCYKHNLSTQIHALTVDHALRPDSRTEAEIISEQVKNFPNISHHILTWSSPSDARIMEEARQARYKLMYEYCQNADIALLYIAHHQNDQAETFLFRLSKGSGLDGLCGMQEIYDYNETLRIIRPLLNTSKADLITYCQKHNLSYVTDPSNSKNNFARPRLRKIWDALEKEGLSTKRLSKTAERFSRSRDALNWFRDKIYTDCVWSTDGSTFINIDSLSVYPMDIRFRVIQKAVLALQPADKVYAPRMEKLEDLIQDIFTINPVLKRTFAHIIFEITTVKGQQALKLTKEIKR